MAIRRVYSWGISKTLSVLLVDSNFSLQSLKCIMAIEIVLEKLENNQPKKHLFLPLLTDLWFSIRSLSSSYTIFPFSMNRWP